MYISRVNDQLTNTMKIICEIIPNISIWADEHQYIVRIKSNSSQKDKHAECKYFPSLDYCFQEVFDYLSKQRLTTGHTKTMEEVSEIIRTTKSEIKSILEPFVSYGVPLKSRHSSAGAGQGALNPESGTLEVANEN